MTFEVVAKAAMPNASKDEIGWALWNRTGYPNFFRGDPARAVYKSLSSYFRACKHGIDLCLHCDNKVDVGQLECRNCYIALGGKASNYPRERSAEE